MKFTFNHGSLERSPWFGCSCCPVNVVRFLPSIPGMGYATQGDDLYVNLFVNGQARVKLEHSEVQLVQQTDYPWDGNIRIRVNPARSHLFTLKVRVPGWARGIQPDCVMMKKDKGAWRAAAFLKEVGH